MAALLEALLAWNGNVNQPTYSQAMKSPDVKKWIEVIMAKLGMLKGMGTWDDKLVRLPSGHHAIKAKWVLVVKRDTDGVIIKYKASCRPRRHAEGGSQLR